MTKFTLKNLHLKNKKEEVEEVGAETEEKPNCNK